jgi:putative transposase
MPGWDYGRNGIYYITICTSGRKCYFGDIVDKMVRLSNSGMLADRYWLEIPDYFHYVKPDQYIIMPNHIHGILEIYKYKRDAIHRVSTVDNHQDRNKEKGGITGTNNPMLYDNLSRVIRWYKGRVTHEIRKYRKDFYWQSGFYDSIIRDANALKNIRIYIKNNPGNWTRDDINPENEINNK